MKAIKGISEKLMLDGLSFVCAHCDHMLRAVSFGLDSCMMSKDGQDCKGPLGNRPNAFPLYSGVLIGMMVNFCFVCGEAPDAAVELPIAGHVMLGVCEHHMEMLSTHTPNGERPPFVTKKYLPLVQ